MLMVPSRGFRKAPLVGREHWRRGPSLVTGRGRGSGYDDLTFDFLGLFFFFSLPEEFLAVYA